MPDESTTRLTLEIQDGRVPITGVLKDESGARQEFCGWTVLASAIEAALGRAEAKSPASEAAARS